MRKTKLGRNLKPGDKIQLVDGISSKPRTALCTVDRVYETRRAWFSGRRMWRVALKDKPWWFGPEIMCYSNERFEVY
jgi:hypothetical protein